MGGGPPRREPETSGLRPMALIDVASFKPSRKIIKGKTNFEKWEERMVRLNELGKLLARTCSDRKFREYLRILGYKAGEIVEILTERKNAVKPNALGPLPDVPLRELCWCLKKENHSQPLIVFYSAGGSCLECSRGGEQDEGGKRDEWIEFYLGEDMVPDPFHVVDGVRRSRCRWGQAV